MLFSQQDLADLMSDSFECVWEELRPAPRVRIDFRNGHVLDRTLGGSVATLFLTPSGEVYDVLPGIVDKPTYARAIVEAASRFDALTVFNGAKIELPEWVEPLEGNAAYVQDFNIEIAKGKSIEVPLKVAIGVDPEVDAAQLDFFYDAPSASEALAMDSKRVLSQLRPQARLLLSELPQATLEEFTIRLFREVLHVDLEDPFLGLAPAVLGGELGRYGPKGADGELPR